MATADKHQQEPAADIQQEAALARSYEAAERKFNALVHDLRLPFLEVKLYQKYFISTKTAERLELLNEVIQVMQENRLQTLRLLKLIQEREVIITEIFNKANEFAANKLTTLEVQTQVLQMLYTHQQVTLKVVEGVLAWRELLTHPFPFQWKGTNYIQKIFDDCADIDSCSLKTVLPLRVSQFPLCSNITSISLFADGGKGPQAGAPAPPPGKGKGGQQGTSPEMTKRLRMAESLIFDESAVQERLVRHLHSIANTGSFVPLLNLQHLIPNCTSGIHVSKKEWDDQNRSAMDKALQSILEQDEDSDAESSDNEDRRSSRASSSRSDHSRSSSRNSYASSRKSSRSASGSRHSAHDQETPKNSRTPSRSRTPESRSPTPSRSRSPSQE